MPILVKIEPIEVPAVIETAPANKPVLSNDQTFNVERAINETITIGPALNETITLPNANATVTLHKNIHDSLMTEDNDDEEMEMAPPLPKSKPPQVPLKLKKNEVFK